MICISAVTVLIAIMGIYAAIEENAVLLLIVSSFYCDWTNFLMAFFELCILAFNFVGAVSYRASCTSGIHWKDWCRAFKRDRSFYIFTIICTWCPQRNRRFHPQYRWTRQYYLHCYKTCQNFAINKISFTSAGLLRNRINTYCSTSILKIQNSFPIFIYLFF